MREGEMIMGVVDRLLLLVAGLALSLLSLAVTLLVLGFLPLDYLGTSIASLYGRWEALLAALLLLAVGIRLLLVNVKNRGQVQQSIIQSSAMGEIRISLTAVESLIQKVMRHVQEVKDVRTRLYLTGDVLTVTLHTVMAGEGNIPEISERIQKLVRERVKDTMGFDVADVTVQVDNIGTERGTIRKLQ